MTTIKTSLFQTTINTTVLLLYLLLLHSTLHWTIIFVPFLFFPLMLVLVASWSIASAAVDFRDISQRIGLIMLVLLFASPAVYPVSSFPEPLQPFLYLIPTTWIVGQILGVVLFGVLPDLGGYIYYTVVAFLVAWFASAHLETSRPHS